MADEPDLQRGASGEWVQYLQQLLEYVGYGPGAAENDFGDATDQAVRAYQQAAGLNADGVVNAATWAALTGGGQAGGEQGEAQGEEQGGQQGAGGGGGDDEVPQEFVAAGAPAQLSQWTDEQRAGYFQGQTSEDVGGDGPVGLEVASISGENEGGENEGEGSLA